MLYKKREAPLHQQKIPGFRRGVDSMPTHCLVLTPEFIIVSASDLFLENTMTRRDDIIGRNIFEVFPHNPNDPMDNGVANLKASFLRVLENKRMDVLELIKYDIPNPRSKSEKFEERYWHPVNFPVFDKFGTLTHIIHNSEDVTVSVAQRRRQALNRPSA